MIREICIEIDCNLPIIRSIELKWWTKLIVMDDSSIGIVLNLSFQQYLKRHYTEEWDFYSVLEH